jgi:tRNA/tmRNA/rRNA uracil-C5-methylase (TrmA/RlmC/RlmD family)
VINPSNRLIYVSCNPATLARDLSRLQNKYHIVVVQPLDMFPQTAEIETVTVLQAK